MGIPPGESSKLGQRYFLDYGLAIRGLLKDFQIDPQEYDRFVDGGLELETKLHPDPSLKNMLQKCTARLFIFTNAGIYHAKRVLQLLGIYDLFEGVLYCDYCEADFPSKPERAAFERAMSVAQIEDVKKQRVYFVDDSVNNVNGGLAIGWESILVDEFLDVDVEILNKNNNINAVVDSGDNFKGDDEKERRIRTIHELPIVLPELF